VEFTDEELNALAVIFHDWDREGFSYRKPLTKELVERLHDKICWQGRG